MDLILRDREQDPVTGFCPCCGRERYGDGPCPWCGCQEQDYEFF